MICPVCFKNEATETVTREFSDSLVSCRVCPSCYYDASRMTRQDFYFVFFERPTRRCLNCGRTLGDILNTMLVGCANCYRDFAKELRPLIESVQKKG